MFKGSIIISSDPKFCFDLSMTGNNKIISLDEDDNLLAMKVENGKTYYFNKVEKLSFLKKELSGKGIILQ